MFKTFIRPARKSLAYRIICSIVSLSFIVTGTPVSAQVLPYMPPVGQLVVQSAKPYSLPYIVGMKFSGDNIFNFTFYLNRGDSPAEEKALRAQVEQANKYFLAALTIPEKDLWVNLSPYEQNRIITPELSRTDLGKDLLGEDYVLKQLASSLTHPDSDSGKQFWSEANKIVAANRIPVNTFNKVWIIPGTIKMKETSDQVVITEAKLKVLTEDDYLARQANTPASKIGNVQSAQNAQAMRNAIVPLIEKEVNTGKHFAQLRQAYYSMIMAGWFKKKLKDTILNDIYFNQKKTGGAENSDPALKDKIYNEYVAAFNQGVYKVIKNERAFNKIIKRQYFSGGFNGEAALGAANKAVPVTPVEVVLARNTAMRGLVGQPGITEDVNAMPEGDFASRGPVTATETDGYSSDFWRVTPLDEGFVSAAKTVELSLYNSQNEGRLSRLRREVVDIGSPLADAIDGLRVQYGDTPYATRLATAYVMAQIQKQDGSVDTSINGQQIDWQGVYDRLSKNRAVKVEDEIEAFFEEVDFAHRDIGKGKKIDELTTEERAGKMRAAKKAGASLEAAAILARAHVMGNNRDPMAAEKRRSDLNNATSRPMNRLAYGASMAPILAISRISPMIRKEIRLAFQMRDIEVSDKDITTIAERLAGEEYIAGLDADLKPIDISDMEAVYPGIADSLPLWEQQRIMDNGYRQELIVEAQQQRAKEKQNRVAQRRAALDMSNVGLGLTPERSQLLVAAVAAAKQVERELRQLLRNNSSVQDRDISEASAVIGQEQVIAGGETAVRIDGARIPAALRKALPNVDFSIVGMGGIAADGSGVVGQGSQGNTGGFDFNEISKSSKVDITNGGFKANAQKATAYLAGGKLTGFKLAIVALKY